ncbi:hypothetical protein IFM89_033300 [Coptis chinensis]|uniref:Uncharacterized protein n=1 Tax=Coptis chinensis TaxID=261450 RepID=A0A835HED0_9MAGN|nr:hypothetical protein IFM89_033300 [Coptis chinensis]
MGLLALLVRIYGIHIIGEMLWDGRFAKMCIPDMVRMERCFGMELILLNLGESVLAWETLRDTSTLLTSAGRWFPFPGMTIYNACKTMLINFKDSLRIELGPDVEVTVVTHGFMLVQNGQRKHLFREDSYKSKIMQLKQGKTLKIMQKEVR